MFCNGSNHPVEISAEGRRAIVLGYEAAVAKRINRTDGAGKLAWRAMMQLQARSLAHAVLNGQPALFVAYLMEP
ncbi:hypothetical protein SR870_17025 [Rhodopseudomonas palustris]|uniref:hypothetical protein n=1 Tax=Rhodopseudomonas palustris TaxID=1076 RepID=UPI002ACDDEB2|nr:hypothetical protein [Rhodopseudomonas palustris]WQG98394.1 hypothetical protein SR870_17025 [Rhodopseudomonas palustris]